MRKACAECGTEFEAKRKAAKFCSGRCTKRAQRRPAGKSDPTEVVPIAPTEPAGSLTAATQATLERAGRAASATGQAALALARRIDGGHTETGSALAAMVREHRAALAEATRDAQTVSDPLDELRARRERRLRSG